MQTVACYPNSLLDLLVYLFCFTMKILYYLYFYCDCIPHRASLFILSDPKKDESVSCKFCHERLQQEGNINFHLQTHHREKP